MATPERTREEILGELVAAVQALPQFVDAQPSIRDHIKRAEHELAQADDPELKEDWRLTVACHKAALAYNRASEACLRRLEARCRAELEAVH